MRRLNGQWPYLPAGLERDTTWAQQGTTGRLEKNGAVLVTEPGRKAYLIADPVSGAVVGYNPLPDLQAWALTTRDGVMLPAPTARSGCCGWNTGRGREGCDISHALKPGQDGDAGQSLHDLGTCRGAARDPEWPSRRCPGRRTGLPDLPGVT